LSFLVTGDEQKDNITNALVEKLMMQSEEIQVSIDQSTADGKAILYVQNLGEL
jgi:hypothetical protein